VPLKDHAPGLDRLLSYDRSWLRGDVIAGITVAAYMIPQVMAYAEVAGLPAAAGLWTVIVTMAVYALFASSRELSVGPETTTALMTAAVVGPLAAGDPVRYAALVAALGVMVGLVCLVAWILKLGFVADLISKPVLVGYLIGVSVLMIIDQLDTLIGVDLDGETPFQLLASFAARLGEAQIPTLVLGLAVLVALFSLGKLFPTAPVPLIVILGASAVVAMFSEGGSFSVVGEIPGGLPSPNLPRVSITDIGDLLLPAIGVATVAFTSNALIGRKFASQKDYRVDTTQELLALGGANLAAGLTQGFPVGSSGSRTVIGVDVGGNSQLYSLVAVGGVLLTLLFFRPVLAAFPTVALSAVVVWAATKLIDIPGLRRLAAFRRSELVLALATTVGVIWVDILYGVLVAIALSLLDLLRRAVRPNDGVLGYVPGVAGMHDIEDYPNAKQVPGLVVFRYDAPLFFANADHFRDSAMSAVDRAEGDVEWFLLNFEANVQIDLTAIDALDDLRRELAGRGIVFALARVKFKMLTELEKAGFVEQIGRDRIFATLPTAVHAYFSAYEEKHGGPPAGVIAPTPPEAPILEPDEEL
jgi:sulfate permease, SulP family